MKVIPPPKIRIERLEDRGPESFTLGDGPTVLKGSTLGGGPERFSLLTKFCGTVNLSIPLTLPK